MPQYKTDEIESTDVRAIRLDRAFNDPVIVHKYGADWAPPRDYNIYHDIQTARFQQICDTEVEAPITKATVPETVVYLATATMDSSYATSELVDIYQYAYRDYLKTWTEANLNDLPAPLNEHPHLSEHEVDMYQRIRTAIKTDRDRWFVKERYEDLESDLSQVCCETAIDSAEGDIDATTRDAIEDVYQENK